MIVLSGDGAAPAGDYVERALGIKISHPRIVLGFMTDKHRPLCAVVLNDYTGANVEMTVVAEPGGITRGVIRYLARYIFGQMGCRRITVHFRRRCSKRIQRVARRIGFVFESVARDFYADDDALTFRMLRADCKWLER